MPVWQWDQNHKLPCDLFVCLFVFFCHSDKTKWLEVAAKLAEVYENLGDVMQVWIFSSSNCFTLALNISKVSTA